MCVLYVVAVLCALMSLSAAAPAAPAAPPPPRDCSKLVHLQTLEERHKIFGKWNLIEGFGSHDMHRQVLKSMGSTWVLLRPNADNRTVLVKQGFRSLFLGECNGVAINMTITDNNTLTLYHGMGSTSTSFTFLQTCPGCLLMSSIDKVNGVRTTFQSLYIYGRDTTLPEADLEAFRKQAECLHFPQTPVFHYNTSNELCPEEIEVPSFRQLKLSEPNSNQGVGVAPS